MVGARVFPRCIDRNDRSTLSIIALWTTVNYIRAVSWHLISKERDVFVSRERERGEADASSKQKITSGKREDEGFMTKRRRFAADVATPFRRDRCRGIAFILSQGSIEGGQWRKREGKMKRNARSRALSRRLFRKRWKRIARWGIDGRAIWVNIFLPHRSIAVVARRRRCFAANVIGTEDESKNLFVRFQFSRKLEGRWKIRYIPRVKDFQINGNIDVTRRVRVIRARQFSSSFSSSC